METIKLNHGNKYSSLENISDVYFNVCYAANPTFGKANVLEDNRNYYIRFDVPGVKKKNISIKIENGRLVVSGERKVEYNDAKQICKERFSGVFTKALKIPTNVNIENIEAELINGSLNITLPKVEKTIKEIKIN